MIFGDHNLKYSNTNLVTGALIGYLTVISSIAADDNLQSETLIITAELEDANVLKIPSSITLIDQQTIQKRNAQQLTELFNIAPNVNFATGASRGRFIQVRGVGERSEFVESTNHSVGVVLDGIDLTGISTAATTLDIQQIEILRGPQGTLYGANGLAGLINLVSNSPTDDFYSKLSASVESFSGRELSAIVSGPASEDLGYRFSIKHFQSNGYINNRYLDRDDTNNLDELSLRGKFVYQVNENNELITTVFFADINNGYDAFSLDSNRNTFSDEPGHDIQKTNAVAFKLDSEINQQYWLETSLSFADSKLEYGYDEDWSNPTICDATACDSDLWGFDWWYSSFDNYQRDNQNTSFDIKLHSAAEDKSNWVAGFYFRDQKVDLVRNYTFEAEDFSSQFDTKNIAVYGQLNTNLSEKVILTTGLRFEKRTADYSDSFNSNFKPDDNLWGGKVSLEYHYATNKMLYGLISRGYKAGGFNTAAELSGDKREYQTEFMWNYEAGIKGNWLDNSLTMQASIFYQDRKDIQSKQSVVRSIDSGLIIQDGGICPCSFTDLTDNAATGNSYGLELEIQWQSTDNLKIYSSLGLLRSEYTKYDNYTHIDADLESIPPTPFSLEGRAFAHAPQHQVVIGADYFISDQWIFNTEVESKGSFYFSDRHEEKSDGYEIVNLRLTYQQENWRLHLYANNLTDKDIETRAFGSFGNDPRNFYETEAYYQLASPRVLGIAFSTEFE